MTAGGFGFRWAVLAATAGALLAACGGGGGSGGGPTLPPPPPPPSLNSPLAITSLNAFPTVDVALATLTRVFQVSDLAEHVYQQVDQRREIQFSWQCPNGETADYDWTDSDQDGKPSPGDSIRVTYRDCDLPHFRGPTASGDYVVTLLSPAFTSTTNEFRLKVEIDAGDLVVSTVGPSPFIIVGSFQFELDRTLLSERRRSFGDVAIRRSLTVPDTGEVLDGFDFIRDHNFVSARYDYDVRGQVSSAQLAGTFNFDPTFTLSGYFNTYPNLGRMEFVGLNGSRAAVRATDDFSGNHIANFEVDDNGDGTFADLVNQQEWYNLVNGYLWWYQPGRSAAIPFYAFDRDRMRALMGSPERDETTGADVVMRLQFDRPIDESRLPPTMTIAHVPPGATQSVPLDVSVDVRGAMLLLTPDRHLRHGHEYQYPERNFDVYDLLNNRDLSNSAIFYIDNAMSAVAAVSQPTALSGEVVNLLSDGSSVDDGVIRDFIWTQVAGTSGTIGNETSPNATFAVPALPATELIEIELQITNEANITARATTYLSAFPSVSEIRLMTVSGEPGEPITGGNDWLVTSADSMFYADRFDTHWIAFSNEPVSPETGEFRAIFQAPDGQVLGIGNYQGVDRYGQGDPARYRMLVHGNSEGCDFETGSFEVLDIAYAPNGDVVRAAIDFEQLCEAGGPLLTGSVRVGSDILPR